MIDMARVTNFISTTLPATISSLGQAHDNANYLARHLAGYSKGPMGLDPALASLTGKWKGVAADAFADRVKTVSDFGVWTASMIDRTIDQHGWHPIPPDKADFAQALGRLLDVYKTAQSDFGLGDHWYDDWCGSWVNMVLRQLVNTKIMPAIPSPDQPPSRPITFSVRIPTLWEHAHDPKNLYNVNFNHDWLGNVSGVTYGQGGERPVHGVATVAYVPRGLAETSGDDHRRITVALTYSEGDIPGLDPILPLPITFEFPVGAIGFTADTDKANQSKINKAWADMIGNRYKQFCLRQLGIALADPKTPLVFPGPRDSSALPKGKDSSTNNSYGGGGGGGDLGLPSGGGFSPSGGVPPLNGSSLSPNTGPYSGSGLSPSSYSPDSYKPGSLTDPYGGSLGHGGNLGGTGLDGGSLAGYDPHGFGGDGASLASYDPHAGGGPGGLSAGSDLGGAGAGPGLGAGGSAGSAGAGAAGTAARGMPMMPAGAGAGAGKDDKGRNRNAYLQEDEGVWGVDGDVGDGVL